MSLIDDAWKAGRNLAGLAASTMRDGVRAVNDLTEDWRAQRENEARWRDIDDRIEKAGVEALKNLDAEQWKPKNDPKGLIYDPFDLVAATGYRERPSAFTYQSMSMVGRGVPVIADVIKVRATQVATFCVLPEDRHSPGFRVRLRDKRNDKMTRAAQKEAAMLEQVLLHTGFLHPKRPQDGVPLADFAMQVVSDSLIFDQVNFEIVPNRKGTPSYLRLLDPSTIRLLDPAVGKSSDPFAVQVIDGSVVADFTRDELAFCIRNKRTGLKSYGYGLSELETLVREITGFLHGMQYNRAYFTQGSSTKGILNFKGAMPDKHLKAFRRQWYAMVAGVANAWRTPITNAEELQWINMQLTNKDMEFSAWMDFLIKIICARYLIAPEEVQFSYGNTGQSQAMGQAPIVEKLKASRDLGLRPLVHWFFRQMNTHLVQRLNEDFEVVPVGLDEKGIEAETDLLEKQQRNYLTIDEARKVAELEPIGEEKGGDLILNPTYLQYVQGQEEGSDESQFGDYDDDGDPDFGEDRLDVDFDDDDDEDDNVHQDGRGDTAAKSETAPEHRSSTTRRVRYVAPFFS